MEAVWFKSGLHSGGLTGELPVVVCLSLCGWDIADGFEHAMVVEPSHPFQRGKLHSFLGFPWCPMVDQLSFVETVDGLRERVVVAVVLAAHRRFNAGFGQALAVANGDGLRPAIAMVNQAAVTLRLTCVSACSKASSTKSVRIELLTRQPTMRRANTSMTKAT